MDSGRFCSPFEVDHRRNVMVLGYSVSQTLFPATDALGKNVRMNEEEFTVIGVMAKRPSLLGGDPDAFAVIPVTTYDKSFDIPRIRGYLQRFLFMGIVGYPGVPRQQLISEVQEVMRARHRLKVDQENEFDIRKALGARRREILWQFLIEAVFLTSIGGLLGIAFGSLIGLVVHLWAGFPVSLPWWSYAIGIGFSASVGILFGLWPAFKASRLDPIDALRYE